MTDSRDPVISLLLHAAATAEVVDTVLGKNIELEKDVGEHASNSA